MIDCDSTKILALIPEVELTLVTLGNFLYPNPPDAKLILSTPPVVDEEFVEYDKSSTCVDRYDNFSGTDDKDILNDVVPTPNAVYDPSYSLSI